MDGQVVEQGKKEARLLRVPRGERREGLVGQNDGAGTRSKVTAVEHSNEHPSKQADI